MSYTKESRADEWRRGFATTLLMGPPGAGKTTALLTWPRPLHVIVVPTELGASSIRGDEAAGVHVYRWGYDPTKPLSYKDAWAELQAITNEVMQGKHGEVATLALDGAHRAYYVMQKAMGYDASTDPKAFSGYHEEATKFFTRILACPIAHRVMTVYDGAEPVEVGSKVTSLFPDFPGQFAKKVLGLFGVVFHAEKAPGVKPRYFWRTRPDGRVGGVVTHLPPDIAARFPAEIDIVMDEHGVLTGGWHTIERILADLG